MVLVPPGQGALLFGDDMEHILSLSYGKDSIACLGAIEELGWPLDRIVHAEVWATDTISADLPPMVEFKAKVDKIIKKRWAIDVEHTRAKRTYEERFYTVRTEKAKKRIGMIYGWPFSVTGAWCNSDVKMPPLKEVEKGGNIVYIGIASDEPNRFHNLTETKNLRLLKPGGMKHIADNGAKKTTCFPRSTQQQHAEAAGFATIRA